MSGLGIWGLSAMVLGVAVGGLSAAPGLATQPPPRVIAIVRSGSQTRLEPVDPRTLRPAPGSWSLRVRPYAEAALSPSGKAVAVIADWNSKVRVLDTATGRIEHRYESGGDPSQGLYWVGGNDAHPVLFTVGESLSGVAGYGVEIAEIPPGSGADDYGDTGAGPPVKEGMVLVFDPTSLGIYSHGDNSEIDLPRMPKSAPFALVADVAHDRLFEISSGGLVAEIDHLANRPSVSYHSIALNGQPFRADWAGGGKIALWGRDGLGMIDTRTWTTQSVAPNVTGVAATPLGLAAWTTDPADGLAIYKADGSKRFQLLTGKSIQNVQALNNYLFVHAGGEYTVDLRTGRVFGPLTPATDTVPVTVVTPALVPIP